MYMGKRCYGPDLDKQAFERGIKLELLVETAQKSKEHGIKFITRPGHFDLLSGTSELRRQIESGLSADEIRRSWEPGLRSYRVLRARYLLYP